METKIKDSSQSSIDEAVKILSAEGVVALPTETVYGLAASALNQAACEKIFLAKGRPSFNPLVVHVLKMDNQLPYLNGLGIIDLTQLSEKGLNTARSLTSKFWPGPLTIVMPKGGRLAPAVTAGLSTVAVRAPAHPIFQAVLKQLDCPLAAPSANRSLRVSPSSAQDVWEELSGKIPMIIDGGPCQVGLESTIVEINEDGSLTILRPGGISNDELQENAFLLVDLQSDESSIRVESIKAPGMMKEHYRPRKPVIKIAKSTQLIDELKSRGWDKLKKIHVICLDGPADSLGSLVTGYMGLVSCDTLSQSGDDSEVARGLYAALRKYDRSEAELLVIVDPERTGKLWDAINDRLIRATAKWS